MQAPWQAEKLFSCQSMKVFCERGSERFRIEFHKQESILRTADCIYEIAECNFREIPEDVIAGIPMGECGEGKRLTKFSIRHH